MMLHGCETSEMQWKRFHAIVKMQIFRSPSHSWAVLKNRYFRPCFLKKNIEAIEHVQNFALKVCQKDWHSDCHPAKHHKCSLPSCQEESIEALSAILHHSEFADLPTSKRVSCYQNCIRSINSATLTQLFAHTVLFQNSFFPSTIELWNTLPFNICTLQSLLHFKQAVSIINLLC